MFLSVDRMVKLSQLTCQLLPYIDRLHLFLKKENNRLQHNTKQLFSVCVKLWHDARCIVKKIPEKFLTEVTFFFKNLSLFLSLCIPRCHRSSSNPRHSLPNAFSPRCSYKFNDTETAVPVIWQNLQTEKKKNNFLFHCYKDTETQESSFKSTIMFFQLKKKRRSVLISIQGCKWSSPQCFSYCKWDLTTGEGSSFKHDLYLWCYTGEELLHITS